MTTIVLDEIGTGRRHAVAVRRLVVAGFTGRDQAAVTAHVEELAAIGVPVPDRTPSIYPLPVDLVTQSEVVVASGPHTSGEVEPVIVVTADGPLLTVGSDHTDRHLETTDIATAKAACPKVVGRTALVPDPAWACDDIALRSTIDGDVPYQLGTMAAILPVPEILDALAAETGQGLTEGDVVFLGTLPVQGGIRPAGSFAAELARGSDVAALSYRVVDGSALGRPLMGKPEIEFTPVEGVAWTAVPGGVPGQAERLLATDVGNGISTRMLRFEPGTDTSAAGVVRHDFWEEVYILDGELHDLSLDEVFPAGTYACRPPGMPHGPWRSEPGCTTFEVRYPAG